MGYIIVLVLGGILVVGLIVAVCNSGKRSVGGTLSKKDSGTGGTGKRE